MTFKDVALKNFKFNIRKYFAYFLCSSFSITVLFMYSTLLFNDEIVSEVIETAIYDMMITSLFIIGVFSFFFISYAHSAFMKSRSKEFGLFLTLGMSPKDVNRITKIENCFIALLSLLFGLAAGTVFSRLFFMIVIKILQLKGINYHLNYKSYALSTALFVLIFIVIILLTKIHTNKLEITELLKRGRKSEVNKINHPILGVIGLISAVSSFGLMHLTLTGVIFGDKLYMIAVYIGMCLVGLYLCISQFGSLSIQLSKKNKNRYFNSIISLTEINHKFMGYKKILYIVCILSGGTIFFIGLTFSLYITTNDMIMKQHPYDIMYVETAAENKLNKEQIEKIINNEDTPLVENKTLEFIQLELYKLYDKGEYELYSHNSTVISDKEVNKVLDEPIDIIKGHAVTWRYNEEVNAWYEKGEIIKLKDKTSDNMYEFDFQEEIYVPLVNIKSNRRYSTHHIIILNDEDYNMIVKKLGTSYISTFHLLKFQDWKNTESIFYNLMNKLKDVNGISNDISVWKSIGIWKDNDIEALRPVSKLENYEHKLRENGFYFFVMCFIGLLFFISSGVVLYFKIYTDLEDSKLRYKKLFKIGITDNEMKKVISKELKPIFFLPVILGSAAGIGYIAVMFVNFALYGKLLLDSMIVVLMYLMFQMIFYLMTRKKYMDELLK